MENVIVVDEFFHKLQLKMLEKNIHSLKWEYPKDFTYHNDAIDYEFRKNDFNIIENYGGLVHQLVFQNKIVSDNIEIVNSFKTLIEKKFNITIKHIQRMKYQLTLPIAIKTEKYATPHWDFAESNSKLVICYLNDCDGDTVIFNESFDGFINTDKKTIFERCKPKKNKAVMFDSKQYHATSYSSVNPRIIVTANILI